MSALDEERRVYDATDPASDAYITLLRTGQILADGTAAECQAWRKLIRAAARQDKVKIATGRCDYQTREGRNRAWARTPERPYGSLTDEEAAQHHRECQARSERIFTPGTPEYEAANEPFPWVPADWTQREGE